MLDDQDWKLARQDMFEALSSGMLGPSSAPMPGAFLEMLEIAALERRMRHGTERLAAETMPVLTPTRIRVGMTVKLQQTWTVFLHAVDTTRTRLRGGRHLPARSSTRAPAA